jgi:hypothetical protein
LINSNVVTKAIDASTTIITVIMRGLIEIFEVKVFGPLDSWTIVK